MQVVYPALFYFDPKESNYFITFPDFEYSATQGESLADAMMMAAEYLGIQVADLIEENHTLPIPTNINELSLIEHNPFREDSEFSQDYDEQQSFISMVTTDVTRYLGMQELVKKTLTIPKWADIAGKELQLNFSQTLTEAILAKKFESS